MQHPIVIEVDDDGHGPRGDHGDVDDGAMCVDDDGPSSNDSDL